jgi:hypothetical protein
MKAMIKFTTLASLILASSAHAKTAWVEGPLWRAPHVTSFALKLAGKEKLSAQCALYKRAIFNEDGSLTYIARNKTSLQRYRKLSESVTLEVIQKPWAPVEVSVAVDDSEENTTEKLPHYTQKDAVTGVLLEDVKEVKISANENSYTEISKKMDLEASVIDFSLSSNGVYTIKFENRDVACDFYEGYGSILIDAPSYVVLSENAANRISDFYNKRLLPELNEVITVKTELLTHKAARIGYRTGKILDDEFSGQSSDQSEKQIRELMKSLLNTKTLEVTTNVIRSGGQLYLNLDAGLEARNVQVKLEF